MQLGFFIFGGFIVIALVLSGLQRAKYNEKKAAFQNDPTNVVKREEFIEAARSQTSDYHQRDMLDTIVTLNTAAVQQTAKPESDLVRELEKLGNLHQQGLLNAQEFAQAKAKLLGKE